MPNIREETRVFTFPRDEAAFAAEWWSTAQAATKWGTTYDTARRRILMHPNLAAMVPVQRARSRRPIFRLCVPVGTRLPDLVSKGNPHFQDPEWQRRNVRRRWGHRPPLQQPPQYHGNDRSINTEKRETP